MSNYDLKRHYHGSIQLIMLRKLAVLSSRKRLIDVCKNVVKVLDPD